jgi:hypothetical protein
LGDASAVANSTIAELQQEADGLRRLVIRLSTIIVESIIEQAGATGIPKDAGPRLLVAISPGEIAPLLREVSMYCARAHRVASDATAARELEDLSAQLADEAQRLETLASRPDK